MPWVVGGVVAVWIVGTISSCIDQNNDPQSARGDIVVEVASDHHHE
jgi:hypothetical protein